MTGQGCVYSPGCGCGEGPGVGHHRLSKAGEQTHRMEREVRWGQLRTKQNTPISQKLSNMRLERVRGSTRHKCQIIFFLSHVERVFLDSGPGTLGTHALSTTGSSSRGAGGLRAKPVLLKCTRQPGQSAANPSLNVPDWLLVSSSKTI